jgi:hypothetical protein
MDMPRKKWTHFAITANSWALGNSVTEAASMLRKHAGPETMRGHGYAIYEFNQPVSHDDIEISDIDGRLRVRAGIEVDLARKMEPNNKGR